MTTKYCIECGKELPIRAKFCKYCGSPVDSLEENSMCILYCTECGKEIASGSVQCSYCGCPVESAYDIQSNNITENTPLSSDNKKSILVMVWRWCYETLFSTKKKILSLTMIAILIAMLIFSFCGKTTVVWITRGPQVHSFSFSGFEAYKNHLIGMLYLLFVVLINFMLCLKSLLSKRREIDPVLHVAFPIITLLLSPCFMGIAYQVMQDDLMKQYSVSENMISLVKDTNSLFGFITFLLWFVFIILSFVKRSRIIAEI